MNKKKWKILVNIISQSIFIMFCIVSICLFGTIISIGIIPEKYLILGLAIILLIYILFGVGTFKRKTPSIIKSLLTIIYLIFTIIYLLIFQHLNITFDFMEKIKAESYQIENYYVIVNKDYNDNDKLKNIGVYNLNNLDKSVFEQLDENIEKVEYNSYTTLIEGLFNNEIDSILMSASNKELILEIITDFDDKTKIINTVEVKVENEMEVSNIDITKESFNIYVSGIDVFGDINKIARSDVNMIITVNPNTNEILLTSIPRDYYVQLHGTTGYKDKLTHAGFYGVDMSVKTIENLLDIDIDYYVRLNFTTLISLVDAIGGIQIYSDTAFVAKADPNCKFQVGNINLNGACALAFSRERYAYKDGDRHRIKNQQDVIKAIANKMLSSKTLITKYTKILETLGESFQTNIPTESIYGMINEQINTMPSWKMYTYSLNGSDSSNYTYTFGEQLLYVMEPKTETIEEAKQKIKLIMAN